MSQITDAIDGTGERGATERVLGYALTATSASRLAAARAAFDEGLDAAAIVLRALPDARGLAWPHDATSLEPVGLGLAIGQTSYRGHVIAAPDSDAGRAWLGTMRLLDELPLMDESEATSCHSLIEAARATLIDVQAGVDLGSLVGEDVELRLARVGDEATSLVEPVLTHGEAVVAIDRNGSIAVGTTGALPFVVDRAGRPWLVGFVVGEAVLTLASLLHAAIDRALSAEEAMHAPRLALGQEKQVHAATTFPPTVHDALCARGHDVAGASRSDTGIVLAAISHELYRDAYADAALEGACVDVSRGEPPAPVPMPARGQTFSIGNTGHG